MRGRFEDCSTLTAAFDFKIQNANTVTRCDIWVIVIVLTKQSQRNSFINSGNNLNSSLIIQSNEKTKF